MATIPNYLDEPPQILLWDFDDMIIFVLMICFGMVAHNLLAFGGVGFMLIRFFRNVKDRRAMGFMLHTLFWYTGVPSGDSRTKPNPFIRHYH